MSNVEYPDWFKEPGFMDLRDYLGEAADDGKRGVMLLFTTQGCSYCHRFLQTSLAEEAIVERLRAHFDVLGLEIFSDAALTAPDGDTMPVKVFAQREGIEFAPGVLFYGADGELLLRIIGYYEPERFERVLDYLIADLGLYKSFQDRERERLATKSKDGNLPPMIASALFSPPPYVLDRSRFPADRPLLVLFEQPGCQRCRAFHRAVLQDAEVTAKLASFDVVRLDASDGHTPVLRPDGARSTGADWARELGFTDYPALVFIDERGGRIIATDALVLRNRMLNLLGLVQDKAYVGGSTYQRYARQKGLARAASRAQD